MYIYTCVFFIPFHFNMLANKIPHSFFLAMSNEPGMRMRVSMDGGSPTSIFIGVVHSKPSRYWGTPISRKPIFVCILCIHIYAYMYIYMCIYVETMNHRVDQINRIQDAMDIYIYRNHESPGWLYIENQQRYHHLNYQDTMNVVDVHIFSSRNQMDVHQKAW